MEEEERGGERAATMQAILVPGWNPNRMQIFFFANFCIQID